MGETRTGISLTVLSDLVVAVLLEITYVEQFTKLIHPVERKNVPQQSPPLPILMVQEGETDTNKNNTETRQGNEQKLALLVTPNICERKSIAVVRKVVLRATSETTVLVSTQAAGIMDVILCSNRPNSILA